MFIKIKCFKPYYTSIRSWLSFDFFLPIAEFFVDYHWLTDELFLSITHIAIDRNRHPEVETDIEAEFYLDGTELI